jgi:pyruvate/2-oxoglutarate dehydrogenase complex dihydrolipoamide acyltransferase (E2) component
MAVRTRPDGTVAASAPGYRRFMPALMPTRNGSAVFFEQKVRVDGTERFVQAVRAAHPDVHVTVFEVLLWALAHTFDRHPNINRFVAGGRLYDRDGIWISFTVKTELSEEGTLLEVKHRFDPTQGFVDLARDVEASVAAARAGAEGLAAKELELFLHLPSPLRRGVVRVAGAANAVNLLPRAFIDGDPFFASAFVTNLGSVGLDAAFHHLYEYGTIPVFCTLGRIHDDVVAVDGQPKVARVATVRFTYDERVEDGLYAGRALDDFRAMLEDPEAHEAHDPSAGATP